MSTRTTRYKARVAVLELDHTWRDDFIEGVVSRSDLETVTQGVVADQAEEDWLKANCPKASDQPVTGVYLVGYNLLDEDGRPLDAEEAGDDSTDGD